MIQIWKWIKNNPNRSMFLLPILLVAGISISHVVSWYDMANPINWAIYLSIAIEVGAITALVAATNRIKGGIWFMFGLVTFIQMIGNIFYSYKEIDSNGELFKSWVELTGPIWELTGTELTDVVGMKRWLAFLEGGLLPIISLTSLHFFVKYEKPEEDKEKKIENKVWEKVKELKKEGKLPPDTTSKELENEPTALANSQYRNEELEDLEHLKEMTEELDEILKEDLEEKEEDDEQNNNLMGDVENEDEIIDDLQPNEVLQNALKKYKESRGDMEKITPKQLKERIINQPIKQPKSNIKRID